MVRAPKWMLSGIAMAALCSILALALISKYKAEHRKISLMPLGPIYMPESFPFSFPQPFDPKKNSLSMVEVKTAN